MFVANKKSFWKGQDIYNIVKDEVSTCDLLLYEWAGYISVIVPTYYLPQYLHFERVRHIAPHRSNYFNIEYIIPIE